jgi:hypothetical protein
MPQYFDLKSLLPGQPKFLDTLDSIIYLLLKDNQSISLSIRCVSSPCSHIVTATDAFKILKQPGIWNLESSTQYVIGLHGNLTMPRPRVPR